MSAIIVARKFGERPGISGNQKAEDFFVASPVTVHGKIKIFVVEKMRLIGFQVGQYIGNY